MNHVSNLYQKEDDGDNEARQIWHTPTELFKPYYGNAIARYIAEKYRHDPRNSRLSIYEVGAGNGTLMMNILDYLEANEPEFYSAARYTVIEISTQLVEKQISHSRHCDKITIVNKSILNWEDHIDESCFFIALEVVVCCYF